MEANDIRQCGKQLFFLCFFAYAMSYLGRYNYSACMPEMIADGVILQSAAGYVSTAFLACYAAGQFFNGMLADRLEPTLMMTCGLFFSGAANILMSFTHSLAFAVIAWALNGYACALLWAPLIKCFADSMMPDQRRAAGIRIAPSIPVGTLLSYGVSALGLHVFPTWRGAFQLCGVLLVASSLIFGFGVWSLRPYFRTVRRLLGARKADPGAGDETSSPFAHMPFWKLLCVTGILFAVAATLCYGVLKDAVAQWIPGYLSETFRIPASTAAFISLALPIVNLCGAYTANYLDRRFFRNEMKTGAVMFLISTLSMLALLLFGSQNVALSILLFSISSASMLGVNVLFFSFIPLKLTQTGRAASIAGFFDASSYFASAVLATVSGVVISSENGGWHAAILLWTFIAVTGAVLCFAGVSFWERGQKCVASEREPREADGEPIRMSNG